MPTYIDTVLKEKLDLYTDAWWNRTLKVIDLDNGGSEIPSPTRKEWSATVKKDLEKLLKSSLEHFAQMVEKEVIEKNESYPITDPDNIDYGKMLDNPFNEVRDEQRAKLKSLLTNQER